MGADSAIVTTLRRVAKRAVLDLKADLYDGKQWASTKGIRSGKLLIEKWLGFWVAFALIIIIGGVGLLSLRFARWIASDVEVGLFSYPISLVVSIGLFLTLLWALTFVTLLLVSAVRVLYWMRKTWSSYWQKNTPPLKHSKTEVPDGPANNHDLDEVTRKIRTSLLNGAMLLAILFFVVLLIQQYFVDALRSTFGSLDISVAAQVLNELIPMVDVLAVSQSLGFSVSALQVVSILLVFVPPAIFICIAIRNLLYYTEARIRLRIEKATAGSKLEWRWLSLLFWMTFSAIYSIGLVYELIYGL